MSLISVIIPVYNRAFIIKDCIDAILNQSFKDFELILINDGSVDNTLSIIEQFSDNRIKCISQQNSGVSSARNKGLDVASGDWICFIDSDDVIKENYLKEFVVNGIQRNQADLYIQNIRVIRNQKSIDEGQEKWLQYYEQPYDRVVSFSEYIEIIDITRVAHPFPKLFKRSIIEKNKIRFNTNYHNAEDCLFLVEFLSKNNSNISCIDVKEYFYQKNDNDNLALSNSQVRGSIDGKLLIQVFCDIFNQSYPCIKTDMAKMSLTRSIQSRLSDAMLYGYKFDYFGKTRKERIQFIKSWVNNQELNPVFKKYYPMPYKSKKRQFLDYFLFKKKYFLFDSMMQLWSKV